MLAGAAQEGGCTGGIDEWLGRTLGARFVLVYGFIAIELRLEGIQTLRLTLFNWTPIVLVDPDVGHPCWFASSV